jgi:transcriptional regulator with XRE-family HTH domain
MKREELLRNSGWWLANIQNDLYGIIYEYMNKHNLKKKDIAEKLGVSKGYVTQILKGDFDHKISKLVDLSLAFGKAPKVTYMDLENYIKNDTENKTENGERKSVEFILHLGSTTPANIDKNMYNNIKAVLCNTAKATQLSEKSVSIEETDFLTFDKTFDLQQ